MTDRDVQQEIYKEYSDVLTARRQKLMSAMEEYDDSVYFPTVKKIREKCESVVGHKKGTFHDNGLGWSWFYCSLCGARFNIENHNT